MVEFRPIDNFRMVLYGTVLNTIKIILSEITHWVQNSSTALPDRQSKFVDTVVYCQCSLPVARYLVLSSPL